MTARSDGVPTTWSVPNDHRPPGVLLFTSATPTLLAATEGEGGFHVPSIDEFFPPAILFEDTIFQIDRIWIIRIVATIVLLAVFVVAARAPSSYLAGSRAPSR